jgi:hypothetical protein
MDGKYWRRIGLVIFAFEGGEDAFCFDEKYVAPVAQD